MNSQEESSFPATVEKGDKIFWYLKAFTDRRVCEREARRIQKEGYKTYVITRVGVDGLYSYPQRRWGTN